VKVIAGKIPDHVRNTRDLVVAEAKRCDGSAFTTTFRNLEQGRQTLLEQAWISADFLVWTAGCRQPYGVFLTHAVEAAKFARGERP
jgi:hypothetical protein